MSEEASVTIPMTAYLKVPTPVDSQGQPFPAEYHVEVEPTVIPRGGTEPLLEANQRRVLLQSELSRRVGQYQQMLLAHDDPGLPEKVEGAKEFASFILTPPGEPADQTGAAPSPAPAAYPPDNPKVQVVGVTVHAAPPTYPVPPPPPAPSYHPPAGRAPELVLEPAPEPAADPPPVARPRPRTKAAHTVWRETNGVPKMGVRGEVRSQRYY